MPAQADLLASIDKCDQAIKLIDSISEERSSLRTQVEGNAITAITAVRTEYIHQLGHAVATEWSESK